MSLRAPSIDGICPLIILHNHGGRGGGGGATVFDERFKVPTPEPSRERVILLSANPQRPIEDHGANSPRYWEIKLITLERRGLEGLGGAGRDIRLLLADWTERVAGPRRRLDWRCGYPAQALTVFYPGYIHIHIHTTRIRAYIHIWYECTVKPTWKLYKSAQWSFEDNGGNVIFEWIQLIKSIREQVRPGSRRCLCAYNVHSTKWNIVVTVANVASAHSPRWAPIRIMKFLNFCILLITSNLISQLP